MTTPERRGRFSAHRLQFPAAALERLENERVCWSVLGTAIVAWAVLGLSLTRGTTFFSDEYTYFIGSRGFNLEAILAPHNGHLIATVRLIYAAVFKLFGPDYLVFRLLEVFGIALVATLFFVRAKRAVGPAVALAPSVTLLFLGSAAPQVTLSPLGITHVYCVAAGLAALLTLERDSRRGDLAACTFLLVSVATFSIGLAFLAGVAVSVLLRGDRWRRCWIFLVPLSLYLAWLAAPKLTGAVYASGTGFTLSNVLLVPNFIAESAAAVAASLAGLDTDFSNASSVSDIPTSAWGFVVAPLAVAALTVRIRRRPVPASLCASLAIVLGFWLSIAVVAGLNRYPYSQRYIYAGGVVVLLAATDALAGYRLSHGAVAALLALTVLALGANLYRLRAAGPFLAANSTSLRAGLTAIQIAGDQATPGFFGPPHGFPAVGDGRLFLAAAAVSTGGGTRPYLSAAQRNGSLGFSLARLRSQPASVREQTDESLVNVLGLRLVPAPTQMHGKCRTVPGAISGVHDFGIRPPGIVLRAPTAEAVTIRRFASAKAVGLGNLSAGKFSALEIPTDQAPDTWHVGVPAGPLTICGPVAAG